MMFQNVLFAIDFAVFESADVQRVLRDLAAHDREALEILTGWQQDPAFAGVKEHLTAMVSRLNGFVGDRNTSPPSE